MTRLLRAVVVVVPWLVVACGTPAPPGFFEHCANDADCDDGLGCLATREGLVCTLRCDVQADCPSVWTVACGEQRICAEGACDFTLCD